MHSRRPRSGLRETVLEPLSQLIDQQGQRLDYQSQPREEKGPKSKQQRTLEPIHQTRSSTSNVPPQALHPPPQPKTGPSRTATFRSYNGPSGPAAIQAAVVNR
jgi:hypothetical protein